MSDGAKKPGKGLAGWLGRQVGHVRRALKAPVDGQVLHARETVETAEHPQRTDVVLRRTTRDEVIRREPEK